MTNKLNSDPVGNLGGACGPGPASGWFLAEQPRARAVWAGPKLINHFCSTHSFFFPPFPEKGRRMWVVQTCVLLPGQIYSQCCKWPLSSHRSSWLFDLLTVSLVPPKACGPPTLGCCLPDCLPLPGSLSCGAREVRSPCAWRGGARPGSRVTGGD